MAVMIAPVGSLDQCHHEDAAAVAKSRPQLITGVAARSPVWDLRIERPNPIWIMGAGQNMVRCGVPRGGPGAEPGQATAVIADQRAALRLRERLAADVGAVEESAAFAHGDRYASGEAIRLLIGRGNPIESSNLSRFLFAHVGIW